MLGTQDIDIVRRADIKGNSYHRKQLEAVKRECIMVNQAFFRKMKQALFVIKNKLSIIYSHSKCTRI